MNLLAKVIIYCALLLAYSYAAAADLLDPRLRDENISNANITVDVSQEGGFYKYLYTIDNPPSNLGTISRFLIDASCDLDFGNVEIPVTVERLGHITDRSKDSQHVPAEVFAAYGTSNLYGISRDNHILWGLFLKPGNSVTNIWVLSPAPPGERTYILAPYLDNNPAVWDYDSYPEDDPSVPWIEDFTITGTITGPACAFDTPNNDDLFEGSGREPFKVNTLLRYTSPVSDPIPLDNVNSSVDMTVYYADGIQNNSFSARLNGKDISSLFNPIAGTKETVTLTGPWDARNRVSLSVLGIVDGRIKGVSQDKRPSQSLNTPAQDNAAIAFDEFKSKDTDTFHIFIKQQ